MSAEAAIAQKPTGEHVGSFRLVDGGRCEIYTRRNRVTFFFMQGGKPAAFHMTVPMASEAARAMFHAAETTPYDEAYQQ